MSECMRDIEDEIERYLFLKVLWRKYIKSYFNIILRRYYGSLEGYIICSVFGR